MEKRLFGWSRYMVSMIGQGTWMMEKADRAQAIASIHAGIRHGLTHIDTAELYGKGEVEKIVGEALKGIRHKIFLVSKVQPSNCSYKNTLKACEGSLKRLKTDYLDSYLIHWRGDDPLEETFKALEELKDQGKIKSYGVSNFSVGDLKESLEIVGERNLSCNQVYYHAKERDIEHKLIPFCRKHNISVVAYSPFAQGDLTDVKSKAGKVLQEIANDRAATPRQVLLQFLLRHENMFVIPKASRVEHVIENATAGDISLSSKDIKKIAEVFLLKKERKTLATV
jgi:diketogulonate reductase-like aldo/keto reductase